MVGLVGSHTILRFYATLQDPTYNPTIFAILLLVFTILTTMQMKP